MPEKLTLAELRKHRGVTQVALSESTGMVQESVSRLERAENVQFDTLDRYVEGLGGRVEILAVFDDATIEINPPRGT